MSDHLHYFLEEVNEGECNHYVMKNCHSLEARREDRKLDISVNMRNLKLKIENLWCCTHKNKQTQETHFLLTTLPCSQGMNYERVLLDQTEPKGHKAYP